MQTIKYYVTACQKCNKMGLMKIEFIEFFDSCCLKMDNLRVVKEFNDEEEAKNWIKQNSKG